VSKGDAAANRLADADRLVELRLDVVEVDDARELTGELLLSVGGIWDRRRGRYLEPGELEEFPSKIQEEFSEENIRELTGHPGQLEFIRWYANWLNDYVDGVSIPKKAGDPCPFCQYPARSRDIDEEEKEYKCRKCKKTYLAIWSVLLAGGQRAGKTQVGTATAAVAHALEAPGSVTWIVAPTDKDFEELEDYLEDCMPRGWYKKLGAPWYRYTLVNGSKIVLRSAHHSQALKKGRADLIIINEAQRIKQSAFAICRGRIADRGGLVVGLANPPDTAIGEWVGDWAIEAEEGMRQSLYFYFDPFANPYINHAPLLALKAELDAHTYEVEILGKFLTGKGMVIHNWDRFANEKPPPKRPNITTEVLQHFEGRQFDRAVTVDVQKHPHMASVEWNFFENPLATKMPARAEWCHMWAVGAILLEAADEFDLARAWLEMGWDPDRTLIVCDASGHWQMAERNTQKLGEIRKKLGGRGSFDAFKAMGFRHVVTPDREALRNPDILERIRTTTGRVKTADVGPYGQHFIFSDPKNKKLNRCVRKWPTRHGKPSRTSDFAHAGDAFTYGPIRFFPRGKHLGEKMSEVEIVKPARGKGLGYGF
jgi:hypothetical protein